VFSDPSGSAEEFSRHANAMLDAPIGARRAHMRLLGLWMAAEAARRSGDKPQDAAAVMSAATVLNHVWVQRAL